MKTQWLLVKPVGSRRTNAGRAEKIVWSVLVLAACQPADVLRVLPGDASAAVSGSLRPPTNVSATPLTFSQVMVSWTDGSPNEAGFQVFRSATASGAFTLVASTVANVTSWTDTGLTASTQYCYKVRAVRGNGRTQTFSDFSAVSCTTTPPPPPPPPPPRPNAPDVVYAEPVDSVTIRVTWWDRSSDELGFRIERSLDQMTWNARATVAPNVEFWTGDDPKAEQGACYRVVAFNVSGDSPPSDPNCAVPPAAPTNFALTVPAPGEIGLTWTDNSSAEIAYEVWIGHGSDCCAGGCDAGWYEYPIASLPPNTAQYRTALVSSECQPIYVFVMATVGSSARATEYLRVPLATIGPEGSRKP